MIQTFTPQITKRSSAILAMVRSGLGIMESQWLPFALRRGYVETLAKPLSFIPALKGEPVHYTTGLDGERFGPEKNPKGYILYSHGGGYLIGSANTHRMLMVYLHKTTGRTVYYHHYRLAPEHRFPAAINDTGAAYRRLLDWGVDAKTIAAGGDSAGGGLSLALVHYAKQHKLPLPGAVFAISPWADIGYNDGSHILRADRDGMLGPSILEIFRNAYAPNPSDRQNPLASPLLGDLSDFPPTLIQVGSEEVLWDDAHNFYEKATAAGSPIQLQVWEGLFHVFQAFPYALPESRQALKEVSGFLAQPAKTVQKV